MDAPMEERVGDSDGPATRAGTNGEPSHHPSRCGGGTECPRGGGERPQGRRPVLRRLSELRPEVTDWLWPLRVPKGELTVVDGDPGANKSSLLLDLAARVSAGRA